MAEKENDTMRFLKFWQLNGGVLTLGEILATHFAAEYRKHITLIRQMAGYTVERVLYRKTPTNNTYKLVYHG